MTEERTRVFCPGCGRRVSVTPKGNIHSHRRGPRGAQPCLFSGTPVSGEALEAPVKRRRGNPLQEQGTAFASRFIEYANAKGAVEWDRAALHSVRDIGDVHGCQVADGLVIELKARRPGSPLRLSDGLTEAVTEARNAGDGIIPVLVVQRSGFKLGDNFWIMRVSDALDLIMERRKR